MSKNRRLHEIKTKTENEREVVLKGYFKNINNVYVCDSLTIGDRSYLE